MYFVIYFDIASLIILLFLMGGIIFRKQYDGKSNRYYLATIIATFVTGIFDIVASLTGLPVWALMLTNSFYFISRLSITLHFVLYIIASSNLWGKFSKNKFLYASIYAPVLIMMVLLIVNIFTHLMFYYDDDKAYHRGILVYIIYTFNYLYGLTGAIILIVKRKTSSVIKLIALICSALLQIGASVTQLLSGSLLLEVFSCTSSLLILWAFVERADDYIEYHTRLYNSNAFNRYIKDKIEIEKDFFVILIHLNNMPRLFSVYTHRKALNILREMANKLAVESRKIDKSSHTYYIDQNTFAVVQNNNEKTSEIINFLDSYLNSVITIKDDVNFAFQPKICVVQYPLDFKDNNSLFNFAASFYNIIDFKGTILDIKNYQLGNEINLLFALDKILDQAIKDKSFEMYFQPIYSVKENKYTCAECLVRLNDATYGFISPAIFIPYAEKTGKMNEIGNIILEKCFEFIASKEFSELGLDYLEINLSILQLLDIDLVERINNLVKHYSVDKNKINFELTETVAIAGDAVIENNIYNLAKEGYKLSLDDFGVGYSNLARLFILPFTIIKADKTIIDRLDNKDKDKLIEKLLHIISTSNFKLVAEGVETKEKLEKVSSLDFDYIQGFYLSKPLPKQEFIQFIKDNS